MKKLIPIMLMLVLAGCVHNPNDPPLAFSDGGSFVAPAGYQVRDTNADTHARALVGYLTHVNPASYSGWAGECPGTDIDAGVFASLCVAKGIDTVMLSNEQATKSNSVAKGTEAATGLLKGDLLTIYFSGHGGQINDNTDPSGKDETLCLYDGELTDKELAKLWTKLPDGVRVFFVTDSCNSGTNFKHGPSRKAKYKARNIKKTLPHEMHFALIHYGGCPDGESSMGSPYGGVFTTALNTAYDRAVKEGRTLTYRTWIEEAQRCAHQKQTFVYAEYGNVSDEFRNKEILK